MNNGTSRDFEWNYTWYPVALSDKSWAFLSLASSCDLLLLLLKKKQTLQWHSARVSWMYWVNVCSALKRTMGERPGCSELIWALWFSVPSLAQIDEGTEFFRGREKQLFSLHPNSWCAGDGAGGRNASCLCQVSAPLQFLADKRNSLLPSCCSGGVKA